MKKKSKRMKFMEAGFATFVGYALGILIVLILSGVCMKPIKTLIKFVLNSVLGILLMAVINFIGSFFGIHIGINPFTAVVVAVLGIPGVIAILIGQIFV